MHIGLVFGKFMPLHVGHLSLIEFAVENCDKLNVILCYNYEDEISGTLREQWLRQALEKYENVTLISFRYDQKEFPNSSISSREASKIWAVAFKRLVPNVNRVFTSEEYGDYLSEYMTIEHLSFDRRRIKNPVSASAIRNNPFYYWKFIADEAKQFFVKKVAILGTESTGKTILSEKLANYFKTVFVPEVGREIVEKTDECKIEQLYQISELHAKKIEKKILKANKLLFLDTDLNITKSYCLFLFNQELKVAAWIEEANKCDLCLFLETDAKYIQDGTRFSKEQRDHLSLSHKRILEKNGIKYIQVSGTWNDRFNRARNIIDTKYFSFNA